MKSSSLLLFLYLLPILLVAQAYQGFSEGDIIFQTSNSSQSQAIQLATGSQWSHVGMLMQNEPGEWVVWEAVQPVKVTPVAAFIARGAGKEFQVMRLKENGLSTENLSRMRQLFNNWKGLDYDWKFNWSDQQFYCSELVWKLYKRAAGIELGAPQPLKNYNLADPRVKAIAEKRWGELPQNELMVAPSTIFESKLLKEVSITVLTN